MLKFGCYSISVCPHPLRSRRIWKSHTGGAPLGPESRRIAPRGCSRAPSCSSSSCWCFLCASPVAGRLRIKEPEFDTPHNSKFRGIMVTPRWEAWINMRKPPVSL